MAAENFDMTGSGKTKLPRVATRRSSRRAHTVYEDLQRQIMLGDLPPLSPVLELDIAEQFQCSQSTVREALIALNHDGLVERIPHRGTIVADSRAEDACEMIKIRRDIETRSVSRILTRYGKLLHSELLGYVAGMKEAARDEDAYGLLLLDRAFHLRLYDAADLPSVRPILERCLIHNHRFKILNSRGAMDLVASAGRHEAIVAAFDEGDPQKIAAALGHHITTVVDFGPDILADGAA